MTIAWGAWQYSGGNGMRIGMEVTNTTPVTGSTTCVFTVKVYTEDQYVYSDNQDLNYSGGSISGSTNFNNTQTTGQQTLRATLTYTFTYSTWGTSPGNRTFVATLSGAYNGITPSVTVVVAVPARPYAVPTAPSAITVTRNSDSQATVAWTIHTSAQAPYTSLTVQRRSATGIGTWSAWATVATTSASAVSWVDTGLHTNQEWQYQVRSNNSVGSSGFVAGATGVAMTPSPPTSVTAGITGGGATITVTIATTNTGYSGAFPVTYDVQRSVAGGAFSNVVTGLAYGATVTWTNVAPGVGTNQYRVLAKANALSSAYTTSNVVTTVVAPNAPTVLSPNGAAIDLQYLGTTLTWQHNPGSDGAAQSHYSIRYSTNGGVSWTPLVTNVASSVSSATVAAGALVNGQVYQWEVATEGVVAAGFGPWSAAAVITATTTPVATLTAGNPGATTSALPMSVEWSYSQSGAIAQVAWIVQVLDAGATSVLYEVDGFDASVALNIAGTDFPFVDGTTYTVRVQLQSGLGLWSAWSSTTTAFTQLPPAAVACVPEYQECTGTMILHLTPAVDVLGVTLPVVSATIERSLDGGATWVTIAADVTLPVDLLDLTPVTAGANLYRVTSASSSPSYFVNPSVTGTGTDGVPGAGMWAFLSYGDSYENVLRVRGALATSTVSSRVRQVVSLLGHGLPVGLVGQATGRVVSVSGTLHYDDPGCTVVDDCYYDSPRDDWEEAAWDAVLVCYRDWTGRRLFGILGDVATPDGPKPGMSGLSFAVTQVGNDSTVI